MYLGVGIDWGSSVGGDEPRIEPILQPHSKSRGPPNPQGQPSQPMVIGLVAGYALEFQSESKENRNLRFRLFGFRENSVFDGFGRRLGCGWAAYRTRARAGARAVPCGRDSGPAASLCFQFLIVQCTDRMIEEFVSLVDWFLICWQSSPAPCQTSIAPPAATRLLPGPCQALTWGVLLLYFPCFSYF